MSKEIVTHSPVVSPTKDENEKTYKAVSFATALEEVVKGKSITKREWDNQEIFGKLINEKLMIKTADGLFHPWTISLGDMTGIDWVIF